MTDITLAVLAHDEGMVAAASMYSAEAAVAHARMAGYTVENVVTLDRPNEITRAFFDQPCFQHWARFEYDLGDHGAVRNAVAPEVTGHFLCCLDGDDLISENWLTRGCEILLQAEAESRDVVVHPEVNWHFEESQQVYVVPQQDDPFFSMNLMATGNVYDSICTVPRRIVLEHNWPLRDLDSGFAIEDYQWFAELADKGWFHAVARDTIIFKRRRAVSQMSRARARNALIRPTDALLIDRINEKPTGMCPRDLKRPPGRQY